jgi:hypothetical protein
MIAARRVHEPPAVAQVPSPGEASTASAVLFTLNVAARAVRDETKEVTTRASGRRERIVMTISFLMLHSESR